MSCFFFKQKTAYEMRISDWSSDVCSSDLGIGLRMELRASVGLDDFSGLVEAVGDPVLRGEELVVLLGERLVERLSEHLDAVQVLHRLPHGGVVAGVAR